MPESFPPLSTPSTFWNAAHRSSAAAAVVTGARRGVAAPVRAAGLDSAAYRSSAAAAVVAGARRGVAALVRAAGLDSAEPCRAPRRRGAGARRQVGILWGPSCVTFLHLEIDEVSHLPSLLGGLKEDHHRHRLEGGTQTSARRENIKLRREAFRSSRPPGAPSRPGDRQKTTQDEKPVPGTVLGPLAADAAKKKHDVGGPGRRRGSSRASLGALAGRPAPHPRPTGSADFPGDGGEFPSPCVGGRRLHRPLGGSKSERCVRRRLR